MRNEASRSTAAVVAGVAVLLALAVTACEVKPLGTVEAEAGLAKLVRGIHWRESYPGAAAPETTAESRSVAETLPDIGKYPVVVEPQMEGNAVSVEIFSSTEKSGKGTDGCLVEIADLFNQRAVRLSSGKVAQVRVRSIPSGTAYEYIAYGKYLPDGFTPSNELWIQMVKAAGVKVTPVSARLVGNTAGIVMKEAVYQSLLARYGSVDVRSVIDAVVAGSISMGYTNPFASSTGLNFLVTVLATFAKGDERKMLSPEVASAFEAFQKGVPFISLTTMQMRDSVEKGGSLDAFIMEYQTYANTQTLKTGYRFIPFGFAHDNPLFAVGDPGAEKVESLRLFANFLEEPSSRRIAERYGFNKDLSFEPLRSLPSGELLVQAQKLWKEKKDLGHPILAVFLSDVSGSMAGARIKRLKEGLIKGSGFVDQRNYIGLAVFASEVTKILPIRQFDQTQRSLFQAAVRDMNASSQTAMYDGITVALEMLVEARRAIPDGKPMLFVLTDGETNTGLTFNRVSRVIQGLKIPVYTISYGEDVAELKRLSSLNEAANLKADTEDIAYQIGALLNAEM